MLKFICSGPTPSHRLCRLFFHANLDRLPELTESYRNAPSHAGRRLQQEFTAILRDICVNEVWKQTSNGRLRETEKAALRFLSAYGLQPADATTPVRILDVGASDGITSLNLLRASDIWGRRPVEITATDLYSTLVRFRKGVVIEYRSADGHPVLVRVGRLGLRLPCSEYRWNRPGNALAKWYLGLGRFRDEMVEERRISLINPAASCTPAIQVVEMDCLKFERSMMDRFDIVRASNIITPRYGFEGRKLELALENIHAYLRSGACLIVSRNHHKTDRESGSVWLKEKTGFVHVEDFGGGSEIKVAANKFAVEVDRPPSSASSPDTLAAGVRAGSSSGVGIFGAVSLGLAFDALSYAELLHPLLGV